MNCAALRGSDTVELAHLCSSVDDLRKHLKNAIYKYDLAIVSSSFSDEDSQSIQELLLTYTAILQIPVVLLVNSRAAQGEVMTRLLMGYDGVLMHPFSIEELSLVVKDAFVSVQQEKQRRAERIMKLLVRSIRETQSDVARQMKRGIPSTVSRQVLRELTQSIRDIPTEYYQPFYHSLFKHYLVEQRSTEQSEEIYGSWGEKKRRNSAGIFMKHLRTANY